MKFKVGDRVKIIAEDDEFFGEVGTIKPRSSGSVFDWHVVIPAKKDGWPCYERELKKVGGRPRKETPVKFIAIYDETDRDPHKTFTSKKELTEWVIEAKEDEDIIFDSIKVFEVSKELEVEVKVSLK